MTTLETIIKKTFHNGRGKIGSIVVIARQDRIIQDIRIPAFS